jgi:ubiquinone/menaquinone biosynthesis C-methylase UbiE
MKPSPLRSGQPLVQKLSVQCVLEFILSGKKPPLKLVIARRSNELLSRTELTGYARWNETQWRLLEQLETLARTGRGVDFHETLRDQEAWSHYQRAMLEVARFDAATLVRLTPIPAGATRLIDLAGGHGLLGAAICRRHPPMRSTVIDLPQALEHSRALAREAGHSDLVDYREGDLLNDPLEESDVALLANILHHFCPTQVTALLGRVRDVLRPGGTVAIWELESQRSGSRVDHGDLVALFFRLTSTSGAYHGTQYARWLAAAGFSAVRVLRPRSSPGRVLVLARAGGSDSRRSRGRLFALRLPFIRQRTSCLDGKQEL